VKSIAANPGLVDPFTINPAITPGPNDRYLCCNVSTPSLAFPQYTGDPTNENGFAFFGPNFQFTALGQGNTVSAWGSNAYGQLGNGTTTDSATAVGVSGLTGVMAIATGTYHSLAVKSDGTAWAWGGNIWGELGNGTNLNSDVPVQVSGLTGVVGVAGCTDSTGACHSLAVKSDGTVWAWGNNGDGQLGNGTWTDPTATPPMDNDSNVPAQVNGVTGAVAVAAGGIHSLALKSDGTVWAWGYNAVGELGNGGYLGQTHVGFGGTFIPTPAQVINLTGAVAIAAGTYQSMALTGDGTVWTWGQHQASGATPGAVLAGAVAIAAGGWEYNLALKNDGTVWVLPDCFYILPCTPAAVSGLSGIVSISAGGAYGDSTALKNDGTVWGWTGPGATPFQVSGLSGAVAIAAGAFHSLALLSSTPATPPPAPSVSSNPANPTNQTNASFGFSDTQGGVTFLCSLDSAALSACSSPQIYPGPLAQGSHSFSVEAQAGPGNVSTAASFSWTVDTTPPVINGAAAPPANGYGWNNTNVTVSFICSDALSGVASCSPPTLLSGEGAGQSVTGTAMDNAGNIAHATVSGINIDKTKPTVNYTGNAGTYSGNQIVNITCTAADTLSGIASTTCANINGPANTFSPGTNTFSATATDKAGNQGSGSTSFTVNINGNLTVSGGENYTFANGKITGNLVMTGGTLVLNNSTVGGDVHMSAGSLVLTNNSSVQGNLQITGGGTFSISSSHIGGNLQIQNIPVGAAQNQICGATVNGNVQFQNNGTAVLIGSPACLGNTVSGSLQVTTNTAATEVYGNTVSGNLQVQNNSAATQVDDNKVSSNLQVQNNTASTAVFSNTVKANLQCSGNNSSLITGGGNIAVQKQGQCASF